MRENINIAINRTYTVQERGPHTAPKFVFGEVDAVRVRVWVHTPPKFSVGASADHTSK